MNPVQARQLVLVSLTISGGVIAYDIIKHKDELGGEKAFKAIWSFGLFALLLSMTADVVPEIAGPFAAVTTLGVVIGRENAVKGIVGVGDKLSKTPTALKNRPERMH